MKENKKTTTIENKFLKEIIFNCLVGICRLNRFFQCNVFVDATRIMLVNMVRQCVLAMDKKMLRTTDVSKSKAKRVFYVKDNYCRLADDRLPKYTCSYQWWIDLDDVLGEENAKQLLQARADAKYAFMPEVC